MFVMISMVICQIQQLMQLRNVLKTVKNSSLMILIEFQMTAENVMPVKMVENYLVVNVC